MHDDTDERDGPSSTLELLRPDAAPAGRSATLELGPGDSQPIEINHEVETDGRWLGRIVGGRYAIDAVLGRGGMGVVYAGRHVTVGRAVAVKVLRSDLTRNAEALKRFEREAYAAAAIGHPNIVEVLDFGHSAEGDAYLVMERLEGEDLASRLRRVGRLDVASAVSIARQVAEALGAAHAKGIVHRDLKSENVFLIQRDGRDFVKVVDFGISKVLETDGATGPITHDGTVLGTPQYMAPEQGTDGAQADHRADLYALGCILFEMLSGSVPYPGRVAVEVLYKHVHQPVPKLRARAPEVPSALEAVVTRLLAKERAHRYPNAEALLAALPASHEGVWAPAPRAAVERWRRRVVAAGLVAVGALVTEYAWRSSLPERVSAYNAEHPDAGALRAVDAALGGDGGVAAALPPLRVQAVAASRDAAPAVAPCEGFVEVSPSQAEVLIDGVVCGRGRCVLRGACGRAMQLSARAEGHLVMRDTVTLARDTALRWVLLATGRRVRPVRGAGVDAGAAAGPSEPQVGPDGLKLSPYRPGA